MGLATLKRTCHHAGAIHAAAVRVRFARSEATRAVARRQLAARLGKLKGLPQKVGQMLSFSLDNDHAGNEFAQLQDRAEPWPVDELLPLVEASWGRPLNDVIAVFDEAGRAASLGQVHRAVLRDGSEVALKIQYPGIRQAIEADVRQLGWLSMPLGGLNRGFNLDEYRQTILAGLQAELDYRFEMRSQAAMRRLAGDHPDIVIPGVLPEYSSGQVLVTQWVSGESWDDVRSRLTRSQREMLAAALCRFFVDGLLIHGRMQSDWHPGNVRIQQGNATACWVLYDFGSMCRLTNEQSAVLARLIVATRAHSESPYPLFLKLGFNSDLLAPLRHKLPALCQVLFEPFIAQHNYDMSEWRLSERVSDILGDDRWNFRLAGPANLIPLLRAFHGLAYYLAGLGVPMRWSNLVEPYLSQLRDDSARIALPPAPADDQGFAGVARWLKIRVRRAGRTIVELTQPAAAVERLSELLDEPLQRRIESNGICLASVVQGIRRRGFTPGVVLALQDDQKEVCVSLE